jgi:hypothetical protein
VIFVSSGKAGILGREFDRMLRGLLQVWHTNVDHGIRSCANSVSPSCHAEENINMVSSVESRQPVGALTIQWESGRDSVARLESATNSRIVAVPVLLWSSTSSIRHSEWPKTLHGQIERPMCLRIDLEASWTGERKSSGSPSSLSCHHHRPALPSQ